MQFLDLVKARFSVRKFTNEEVSDDDLNYLKEAIRLAPSACNRQPWRFLIVRSDEEKNRLREVYDRPWFKTAPLYFVCYKNTSTCWVRPDDDKPHGDVDVAIATEHLCLAAAERGLGSCWVCNYNTEKMKSLFPMKDYEAVAIVPVGHVDPDCPHLAKVRKSSDEIFEEI